MITPRLLYRGQPDSTSRIVIYTQPANTTVAIKEILVTNVTGGPVHFTLWAYTNAGVGTVITDNDLIISKLTIPGNGLFQLSCAVVLVGKTVSVQTSVAAALTFNISGYEES